jgi:lysophospholipid acyltransferase (LPLAT)-like uncharacterized protein
MARKQLKFIVIPYLIKLLMWLIMMTCRVRWHNRHAWDELQQSGQAYVIGVWHNCSTISAWAMRGNSISVMVSDSNDGEYAARLVKLFGNNTVRGSSSRRGQKAIKDALMLLRENKPIAITPDGPRGPCYQVQSGILWFAATAGVPILPLHIESSRQWVLDSWDGHLFPKPFSTMHIGLGRPTIVSREMMRNNPDDAVKIVRGAMMDNVYAMQTASGRGLTV